MGTSSRTVAARNMAYFKQFSAWITWIEYFEMYYPINTALLSYVCAV